MIPNDTLRPFVMKSPLLTLGSLLLLPLPLSAATLVGYNFDTTSTAVSASAPGVITEALSLNTGTSAGNSGFVRSVNTPEEGAGSLAITFANLDNAAAPTGGAAAPDNVSFTVSATAGQFLQLQSLTFLTGLNTTQPNGAVYTVQYNLGAGYVNIGSDFTHTADAPESRTIDLSDPMFSSVSSISFRINMTEPVGATNATGASARLDLISLNGNVIPEPSSVALLGAAALFAIGCRSRR